MVYAPTPNCNKFHAQTVKIAAHTITLLNSGDRSATMSVMRLRQTAIAWLAVLCSSAAIARAEDTAQRCNPIKTNGGELFEAIAGYEQSGGSAAKHTQDFFFDFFISRPLPLGPYPCGPGHEDYEFFGPRLRWWGNVRVASYPQQINAPVATFAAEFPNQILNQPVNKLAQTAEFITGLEWRLAQFGHPLNGNDRDERQQFALSICGGGGPAGPREPIDTIQLYETPPVNSAQRPAFEQAFPSAAKSPFVGFVSPDRDRFFRQYSGGIRLTTYYVKKGQAGRPDMPYLAAPAIVSVSVGQNEMITGGRMTGVVGRFEAFYPLVFAGDRSDRAGILYLFGTAMLHLGGAKQTDPLILKPATNVQPFDPGVALVTSAGNRDVYVIGVGLDLGQLLKKPSKLTP